MELTEVALVAFCTLGLIAVACVVGTLIACYLCREHRARVEPSSAASSATNLIDGNLDNNNTDNDDDDTDARDEIPVAIVCS